MAVTRSDLQHLEPGFYWALLLDHSNGLGPQWKPIELERSGGSIHPTFLGIGDLEEPPVVLQMGPQFFELMGTLPTAEAG